MLNTDFLTIFSTPGTGEIALVAILIFEVVLLLGLLIRSDWSWGIKATATIMAGVIFIISYFAILDMQGWPTVDTMPDKFELLSFYVDSPNPAIGKAGSIIIWTLEESDKIGTKPRAYSIDYDKKLHKKLQEAMKQKGDGGRMQGQKGKKGKHPLSDATYDELFFYNMPIPPLPTKE